MTVEQHSFNNDLAQITAERDELRQKLDEARKYIAGIKVIMRPLLDSSDDVARMTAREILQVSAVEEFIGSHSKRGALR